MVIVWEPWSMTPNSRLNFFSLLIIHLCDAHSDIQGYVTFSSLSNLEIQDGRQYGRQQLGD